jgi:prefoldin subunit 5
MRCLLQRVAESIETISLWTWSKDTFMCFNGKEAYCIVQYQVLTLNVIMDVGRDLHVGKSVSETTKKRKSLTPRRVLIFE